MRPDAERMTGRFPPEPSPGQPPPQIYRVLDGRSRRTEISEKDVCSEIFFADKTGWLVCPGYSLLDEQDCLDCAWLHGMKGTDARMIPPWLDGCSNVWRGGVPKKQAVERWKRLPTRAPSGTTKRKRVRKRSGRPLLSRVFALPALGPHSAACGLRRRGSSPWQATQSGQIAREVPWRPGFFPNDARWACAGLTRQRGAVSAAPALSSRRRERRGSHR